LACWDKRLAGRVIFYSIYLNNEKKSNLHLHVLVLSEFVNRVLRIQYEGYLHLVHKKPKEFPFKQYRDSDLIGDLRESIRRPHACWIVFEYESHFKGKAYQNVLTLYVDVNIMKD